MHPDTEVSPLSPGTTGQDQTVFRRLIEFDLPIREISAFSPTDKSAKRGHIKLLHMWWARRPLPGCRAVTLAALLPDPVDVPEPSPYVDVVRSWAIRWSGQGLHLFGAATHRRWVARQADPDALAAPEELRAALFDFIIDFADPANATRTEFLTACRELTAAASMETSGSPAALVVDPFAGGAAFPLEALRVGANAFASDLNPVAVLLNKVAVEYAPAYGAELRDEVETRGRELLDRVRHRLASFYPDDADDSTPIVYLWARTLRCQGPGCGIEIPLLSNLAITKRRDPPVAVFLDARDDVVTLDVREVKDEEHVAAGTARGGRVVCPSCGYPMQPEAYRQYARRSGLGERLFGVVTRDSSGTRRYRNATSVDQAAFQAAASARADVAQPSGLSPFPDETLSEDEPRRLNIRLYGFSDWGSLFNPRQQLAIATFGDALKEIAEEMAADGIAPGLVRATRVVLALALSNMTHYLSSMSTYLSDGMVSAFSQSSAIAMRSDYAEANPLMDDLVGGFAFQLSQTLSALDHLVASELSPGVATKGNAVSTHLPDESVDAVITDPPYYAAIPYADLSDLFYVWLRRFLADAMPELFTDDVTPKAEEAIQSLPHSQSPSNKDRSHFESTMQSALQEARRILKPEGIAVIVFANATTEGWESLLRAVVDAEWVVTASWPLETERADRMLASRQSVLASSVHLVCRPRSSALDEAWNSVGDWRDVLDQLPRTIGAWMARLAREGIVGADAIFACLGPALELYSRYSRLEKASGDRVTLDEYLAHVWSAIAHEALALVFQDADVSSFEEDARLTAMWLWTIVAAESNEGETGEGLVMEYDSARKLAQGLGAHLEDLVSLVEVKKDKARLRSVRERSEDLFEERGPSVPAADAPQRSLFVASQTNEPAPRARAVGRNTVLDHLHQSMLLFGEGRSEALRQLLVEEAVGRNPRFWSLAQVVSVLYPAGGEEKRWVDGVLGRKRGLGFS